jgi:hypothetical protein
MLPSPENLLLVQFMATGLMTGIIWFVQIVHYPLFRKIPPEGFTRYEQAHTVRTGVVVAPLMILELASAALLPILRIPIASTHAYLATLGCLLLIWASTFLIQVPLHGVLEQCPDTRAMNRLVTTNWIRTMLWSARLALLAPMVLSVGGR